MMEWKIIVNDLLFVLFITSIIDYSFFETTFKVFSNEKIHRTKYLSLSILQSDVLTFL